MIVIDVHAEKVLAGPSESEACDRHGNVRSQKDHFGKPIFQITELPTKRGKRIEIAVGWQFSESEPDDIDLSVEVRKDKTTASFGVRLAREYQPWQRLRMLGGDVFRRKPTH